MKTTITSIASQLAKQLAISTIFNECDIESLHRYPPILLQLQHKHTGHQLAASWLCHACSYVYN